MTTGGPLTICDVATSQGSFCPLLAPTDQEAQCSRDPSPGKVPAPEAALRGGLWGALMKRAVGSTDGPQSKALKRKEREAPQESPKARKKVMRAPATSLSCGSTCLGARHMVRDTK